MIDVDCICWETRGGKNGWEDGYDGPGLWRDSYGRGGQDEVLLIIEDDGSSGDENGERGVGLVRRGEGRCRVRDTAGTVVDGHCEGIRGSIWKGRWN